MTRFEEGVFEPLEHVGFLDQCGEVFQCFQSGETKKQLFEIQSKQLVLIEMVCIKQIHKL